MAGPEFRGGRGAERNILLEARESPRDTKSVYRFSFFFLSSFSSPSCVVSRTGLLRSSALFLSARPLSIPIAAGRAGLRSGRKPTSPPSMDGRSGSRPNTSTWENCNFFCQRCFGFFWARRALCSVKKEGTPVAEEQKQAHAAARGEIAKRNSREYFRRRSGIIFRNFGF